MIESFNSYPGFYDDRRMRTEIPFLTLYIPSIGQEITLCRDCISVGNSKFRDLDLSQLPNAQYIKPHQATFIFRDGIWHLTSQYIGESTCLNGRNLDDGSYPLRKGDYIVLGGREVLIIRDAGAKPTPEAQKLDHGIQLFFESIHLVNGHVGSSVTFDAARRMIVSQQWGIIGNHEQDSTPKEYPVPEYVVTVDDLYRYAERELHIRVNARKIAFQQDVLLWLSSDCLTQYVAERQEVLYRKQTPGPHGEPIIKEDWLRIIGSNETEEDIRKYARRCWVHIPHNRKSDLDEDILLGNSSTDGKLTYLAEPRIVIRSMPSRFGKEPALEESLPIPDNITEHNELLWYINFHRRSWSKFRLHADEMFHDMVLSSGKKKIEGRRVQYETRYIAETRTVIHKNWDIGIGARELPTPAPLLVPYTTFNKESLCKYVWEKRPDWK